MAGPRHRVEKVALRSVWPLEQQDFSRWLIDNIDFLNERLPFDVDPESLLAEQAAGAFSVDVVGEAIDSTGEPFKIVIENQLERTDHDHLGKVITYVAAFGARAAIWISGEARPEHAKAVQWLNDESNIDAWLFDVEVIRIADSPSAPLLTQIVGPSALSKKVKAEKQADQADRQNQNEWWATLLPVLAERCADLGVWQGRSPVRSVAMWESVPRSPGRIGWQIWVTSHGSWICLRVDGESQAEAQHYFEGLLEQRNEIEHLFGAGLQWKPLDKYRASLLRWDNTVPGGYRDGKDAWGDASRSIADAMRRLVEATKERVQALPAYAPEPISGRGEMFEESDSAVAEGHFEPPEWDNA